MSSLLRYQFRRLFKNKSLYICSIISVVIIFLYALVARSIGKDFGITTMTALTSVKGSLDNGMFSILAAIVISIFATEDYNAETIKNIYSKGYTKTQTFFANYIVSLVAALIMVSVSFLGGFLSGLALLPDIGTMGDNYILSIVGIAVVAIGYHAMFFGISSALRKGGAAIAISIVFPLVMSAVLLLADSLLSDKLNGFHFTEYSLSGRLNFLKQENVELIEIWKSIGVSLGIGAIFVAGSFFINKKRQG